MSRAAASLAAALALALVAGALAAACVVDDADVLTLGPVLRSCDEVPRRVSDRQACDFTGVCNLTLPGSPACCAELVTCSGGALSVHPYCDDGCVSCAGDAECPRGERLCDGQQCVACPDPSTCEPCGDGTQLLERNGCVTCECGPPAQCSPADNTPCDPMDPTSTCYPGLRCGAGCQAGEPGCCLNVCAAPGCSSPAPLGCDTPCPVELGCQTCQTAACRCDGMAWTCDAVCAPTTGACFFPR